jgi:predicted TIM-barrel enzyme
MRVYPVVHINNHESAVDQAELALELGADGVYLIDHKAVDDQLLFDVFNDLDAAKPNSYIGMNLLGLSPLNAMKSIEHAIQSGDLSRTPNGLWADDATRESQPGEVMAYKNSHDALHQMRYLGGVAFKYTATFTEDPRLASEQVALLRDRVDVVTTSGMGTGKPPTRAKMAAMKTTVGDTLAVASGISYENIRDYAGLVDETLVASSVETAPYSGIFDRSKLEAFIAAAHDL